MVKVLFNLVHFTSVDGTMMAGIQRKTNKEAGQLRHFIFFGGLSKPKICAKQGVWKANFC